MKEDNAVATVDSSPSAMMARAISQPGMDLEKVQKFMELQERYEAREARKAYTVAMSAFKADPPEIEKDKHVKFGNTEYNHASLSNVTTKINAALSKHGLSASWETAQTDKGVAVTCKITHIGGHFETTTLVAANDTSGAKNAIQALGSTVSYLQRYTILALTGLATHDMDTDCAPVAMIDEKQLSALMDIIDAKQIDKDKFLRFMDVDSFEAIRASDVPKAMQAAKAAKGAAK